MRKSLLISVWIFLVALGVRLIYLFQVSGHPAFAHPLVDSGKYYELALALSQGRPMNLEFFWQVFLYPLFLSGIFSAFGASLVVAKVVQMVIGAATCVMVYHLASKLFGKSIAIAAALIVALYGPLIFFEGEILATGLAAFWAVALMLLYLRVETAGKWPTFFVLGVISVVSVLTRVTFLPFVLITGLWVVIQAFRRQEEKRTILFRTAVLTAGFVLVALPVALKCRKVSGRFSILPETGALNLYMGNNGRDTNYMAIRPGSEWDRLLNEPIRAGVKTRAEARQFFMDRFWSYVFHEPARFMKGLLIKTVQFLSSREPPSNLDPYTMREHSSILAVLMWKAGGFGFPFGLLLPLTLLGIVVSFRKLPACFFLFFLLYPAAIVLVFVTARYRAPMVPVMAVAAAAGLMHLVDRFKEKRYASLLLSIAVLSLIAMGCSLAGPFPSERVDYEAEFDFCMGTELEKDNRPDEAKAYFQKAIDQNPAYASAHEHLGTLLLHQGKIDDGIRHLKEALRIDPEIESANFVLGQALAQQAAAAAALPYLEKAVAINPRSVEFARTLGATYGRLNRPAEALEQFDRALAMRPGSPNELYQSAISLYQLGRFDEALDRLAAALKIVRRTGNRSLEGKIQMMGAQVSREQRGK